MVQASKDVINLFYICLGADSSGGRC